MFSIVAPSVYVCTNIKYPISCIQAALWLALANKMQWQWHCVTSLWLGDLFPVPVGVSSLFLFLQWYVMFRLRAGVLGDSVPQRLVSSFCCTFVTTPPHPVSARLLLFMIWCSGLLISLLFWSRLMAGLLYTWTSGFYHFIASSLWLTLLYISRKTCEGEASCLS